jgi:hypothetical protein
MTKNARSLDEIAADIHAADRANIFTKGDLLLEAKESHPGEFLKWLEEEEFEEPLSPDTAGRWMKVAQLGKRFRNLRNLKLAKTTLYDLTEEKDEALQSSMIEALAGRATKVHLKAADAYEVIELARLRHQHGDLPNATLWGLYSLPDGKAWSEAASAALKERKPVTDEAADGIIEEVKRAHVEIPTEPPPESEEPDDREPGSEASDDDQADETNVTDANESEALPTPPADTLPEDLIEAVRVVLHYARRPAPKTVNGITGPDLIEARDYFDALHKIMRTAASVKAAADRAEARARGAMTGEARP